MDSMYGFHPKGKPTSEGLIPPDCGSSIYSYQETIFKQFVKKDDEDTKKALIDYAKKYVETKNNYIRLLFLDQDIAEAIIDLGIKEYLRRRECLEK